MNDEITIASARASDVETSVALLDAQLREHDIVTAEKRLRAVVQSVVDDESHGFVLLASSRGRRVGIAYAAAHLSAEHGGVIGWLEELYVLPDFRGRGIGSLLLAELLARAQTLQWRGVELEVVAGHERAAALYLRHGFVAVPRARYTRIFSGDLGAAPKAL